MNRFLILCFCSFTLLACNRKGNLTSVGTNELYQPQQIDFDQTLTTIALGSCNRQDLPQDMWEHILVQKPQLWVWLGDNIYGDSEDMSVMKAKYMRQKYAPEYVAFRKQLPIIGTWDDHDFGVNDGGKEFGKRAESQELMLDFLDVPQDAPVRTQAGVYQSYTFGPKGKEVKIILLDSRYHRDATVDNPDPKSRYLPNETGTILGEAQWQWLEQELRSSEAQVHIIANGIQVIPEDHGYEKWANFPKERTRLLDLLRKHSVKRPVLVSGDRHIAEISKMTFPYYDYPVYELTTSGLTHSYDKVGDEPNQHRVSKLIGELNFGIIQIDWSAGAAPGVRIEVRGKNEKIHTALNLD